MEKKNKKKKQQNRPKVKQPDIKSITRDSDSADKPEGDVALILLPPLPSTHRFTGI